MIKFLFAGAHLILLAWMAMMGVESPKVQQVLPLHLELNESSVVKVTIQKSKLQGFAKLEIDIPEGYAVAALDTKGASFTFSKGKMRFVWMNLPNSDKFDISYRLTHIGNDASLQDVKGVFSFIDNNKRNDVAIVSQINSAPVKVVDENGYGITTLNANQDNPSCERKVTKSGDGFTVELLIHLNGLKGFLKLQEWVSEGCALSKSQTAAATVTVDGSKIKFVWFEVPESETMVVKYKVNCAELPENGLQIEGKLSFVFENNPREVPVTMMENKPAVEPVVEEKQKEIVVEEKQQQQEVVAEVKVEKVQEEKKEQKIEVPIKENKTVAIVPKEKKEKVVAESNTEVVAEVNAAQRTGIQYKVQILANHRKVSAQEWKSKYGFQDQYQVENHEGWMKWTHGDYTEYKQAKQYRNELTAKCPQLPGPFVTAYQNGQRITVQEALMATQQPWVQ